jgi:hypothetical protein
MDKDQDIKSKYNIHSSKAEVIHLSHDQHIYHTFSEWRRENLHLHDRELFNVLGRSSDH